MNNKLNTDGQTCLAVAQRNYAQLMTHVARLYCMDGSSSVNISEAAQLTASVLYVLGIANATAEEAAMELCVDDPVALWHKRLAELDARVDTALATWQRIILAMPPIRNVALRDTLASLGDLKRRYDTRFAAHEVPCDIDYQLSEPVDTHLQGLDYIEAYLAQLERETSWIACLDTADCIAVLERICPDYRGLHVNLYDLLAAHTAELRTRATPCSHSALPPLTTSPTSTARGAAGACP